MFVTDEKITQVARDLQPLFEVGALHSCSSIRDIVPHAGEELHAQGLPTRRSLAIVVAKLALAIWIGTVFATKKEVA